MCRCCFAASAAVHDVLADWAWLSSAWQAAGSNPGDFSDACQYQVLVNASQHVHSCMLKLQAMLVHDQDGSHIPEAGTSQGCKALVQYFRLHSLHSLTVACSDLACAANGLHDGLADMRQVACTRPCWIDDWESDAWCFAEQTSAG